MFFAILHMLWEMVTDRHSLPFTAFFLAMNLAAFFCYGRDKRLARKQKWRTPEKLLLGLGFFGGAAGALAGMQLFRHKTKHWYFWVVNLLGLLWQAACLWWVYDSVLWQYVLDD